MKRIILSIAVLSIVNADLSMEQIRHMVQKIHDKRDGVSSDKLQETPEPFVRLEKENNTTTFVIPHKSEDVKFSLNGILNQSAYINGGWKKMDDNISGYTLKYIGKKGVVLRNRHQIKKLFISQNRENFIIVKEGK